jgi:hypothetical protein
VKVLALVCLSIVVTGLLILERKTQAARPVPAPQLTEAQVAAAAMNGDGALPIWVKPNLPAQQFETDFAVKSGTTIAFVRFTNASPNPYESVIFTCDIVAAKCHN